MLGDGEGCEGAATAGFNDLNMQLLQACEQSRRTESKLAWKSCSFPMEFTV